MCGAVDIIEHLLNVSTHHLHQTSNLHPDRWPTDEPEQWLALSVGIIYIQKRIKLT